MRFPALLILLLACSCAWSQKTVWESRKLEQPPLIDGVVGEEEWQSAAKSEGGYDEQTGAREATRSRYFIAYDSNFIYVAAQLEEPDSASVRHTESRTNVSLSGDDRVIFAIDPFSTLGDTNQFEINANGATNIRIAGGRAAKREWLGEILAKGRITESGWEVEARIPWSLLRLPSPGKREARILFGRVHVRTARSYFIDDISGGKESNIGVWSGVEIPRVQRRRSLKLLPYVYFGADRDGVIANAGGDFKLPVTSDLDLVGSVNPDFRNVENQVLSLDFSYFERLAGESRPFFLEGRDYFSTSQDAPLFVSQRIRGFDIGSKIYGKVGENSTLGLLNTIDFDNTVATVGNARYSFNQATSLRVSMANRETDENSNLGTFVGLNHDFAPFSFFAQHMTTTDSAVGDGHRYNTGITFSKNGLGGFVEYLEISPDFLPRLGFAPERNLKGFSGNLDYERQIKSGSVSEISASIFGLDYRNFQGEQYRRMVSLGFDTGFRSGLYISTGFNHHEIEGFSDSLFSFMILNPRGNPYRRWVFSAQAGNVAGHSYRSYSPSFAYRPIKNLQLNLSYQRVEHIVNAEQAIFAANWDISEGDSLGGRAIRRNKDTNFYIAYRRTGVTGNEYFLILGDPNARTFRTSLILKAVFPFEFRF